MHVYVCINIWLCVYNIHTCTDNVTLSRAPSSHDCADLLRLSVSLSLGQHRTWLSHRLCRRVCPEETGYCDPKHQGKWSFCMFVYVCISVWLHRSSQTPLHICNILRMATTLISTHCFHSALCSITSITDLIWTRNNSSSLSPQTFQKSPRLWVKRGTREQTDAQTNPTEGDIL